MPMYTGSECPICGKAFTDADDIVVCPECGSPHHRVCYKTVGHCGNEEQHKENWQWQPTRSPDPAQDAAEAVEDVVVCRTCGEQNPPANIFCQKCGQKIMGTPSQTPPPNNDRPYAPQYGHPGASADPFSMLGMPPMNMEEELEQGVTVKDACDYLGLGNFSFIMKFKAIKAGRITFNWSAFFLGFFYCFYRRMNRMGAVLMGVLLTAYAAMSIMMAQVMQVLMGGAQEITIAQLQEQLMDLTQPGAREAVLLSMSFWLILLAGMLFSGFFFNRFYYKNMIKSISKFKQNETVPPNTPEYRYAIASLGGVRPTAPLLAMGAIFVANILYTYVSLFFIAK